MTNIYFVYRYQTDRQGNRYTPYHTLQGAYPEWGDAATIIVEKISTSQSMGKRLGWVEVDDTVLSPTDIEAEVKNFGIAAMMNHITNDEAVAYMQNYTDYPEVEPRKFELQAEYTDEDGNTVPAEYLTIA